MLRSNFIKSFLSGFRWYRRYYGGRWERHWIDICGSDIWLNMHPARKWPEYRQPCSHGTPTIEVWPIQTEEALFQRMEHLYNQMEERKDAAYLERNQVVAALAKCFPSGTARTAIEGWSEDWHGCLYIDLPTGQASWHYHDSHAYLFKDLLPYQGQWDGHTTDQKYARLALLRAKDRCEICHGSKGGVLGNENILEGKRVCDYCHSDIMRKAMCEGSTP